MTEGCLRAVVEAIHSSPTQAVLYVSGGASQALGHLMSVPGASNTVLESVVPYSRMSIIQLLGKVLIMIFFKHILIKFEFFMNDWMRLNSRFLLILLRSKLLRKWLYWLTIAPSSSLTQVNHYHFTCKYCY